jgi:hypothetical protein
MEDQIPEIAGDGLGFVMMEFTKYQAYNDKKFDVEVSFEYDRLSFKKTIS